MFVPFAEYLPDLPDLMNQGATVANNVFPRSAKSYGPLPDFSVYSGALSARCQGFYAGRSSAGNVTNFAGDASKLYTLSDVTWGDVSKSGGYTTNNTESWRFAQYKDLVAATNFGDAIQAWTLDTSSAFADLSADAPQARHIAMIDPGFLMVGNTIDGDDGAVPNRVWWPAIGDPTSWPTPGTAAAEAAQSDFQDLATGGWVQGLVGAVGGARGAVFMDTSIYRIEYEGPGTVFGFYEVERARGCPAPGSIVHLGAFVFYLGDDGFYLFDGTRSVPIGANKLDRTFLSNVDEDSLHRITATHDPVNKLIFVSYPSSGSSGTPDKLLVYNWEIGRWATGDATIEILVRSMAQGYTLDGLDDLGYTIDTLPFSLDSRVWTGGRPILSGFDTDHKLGFFNGSNLEATLETGEFDGGDGQRVFISGVRAVVDASAPTVQIGQRDTQSGALTYTTATSAGADGVCPQRISTRYARARVSIPSGDWTHAQGVEPVFKKEGKR